MLFQQLSTIIPGFNLDIGLKNKIIMEDSNQCTGEWLPLYLLESFLRDSKSRVVFVASQNSILHYQTVLKKISGLNLQTSMQKGQLVFIDAFSQPTSGMAYENLPISTSVPNTYQLQTNSKAHAFSCDETAA